MKTASVQRNAINQGSLSKRLNTLAAILIIIIGIRFIAADLIAPILIAAMFAVLLLPIFNTFRTRGLSRNWSLLLTVISVLASACILILILQYSFGLIAESAQQIISYASQATEQENTTGKITQQIEESLQQIFSPQILLNYINTLTEGLSNLFFYFLVIPVLAIVIVAQIDSFSETFKDQLEGSGPLFNKFKKFSDSMRAYIIGRFKVNLSTALFLYVAFLIMGIDYAILWGLLTLILGFIPYIGIIIAGIGPFIIVISQYGITGAVILLIVFLVITSITENVIDPMVQGRENRLTTLSLIIGFIFWSWLFGVLGAIISAPLTVMLKTIFEDYKETRWIALLMVGDYSKTPKSKQYYKKLFQKFRSKLPKV